MRLLISKVRNAITVKDRGYTLERSVTQLDIQLHKDISYKMNKLLSTKGRDCTTKFATGLKIDH